MKISEFLDRLGGRLAVADALGLRRSSINMWVFNGVIPAKHHVPLLEMAQTASIDVTPFDIRDMRERVGG